MSDEWLSSDPAVPGWYPASVDKDSTCRRYWNGSAWSAPVYAGDPRKYWQHAALLPATLEPGMRLKFQDDRDLRDQIERWLANADNVAACPGRFVPATSLLEAAAQHMRDRAAAYDKPDGERSMARTVEAFNAITGRADSHGQLKARSLLIGLLSGCKATGRMPDRDALIEALEGALRYLDCPAPHLRESEGWLFMELLKAVRDYTTDGGHADSQEDRIAYAALAAEARRAGK